MTNTKVWAHRGASGYAPENTIEAFKLAIKMGADGVELDVRLTKDNQVVVIHDAGINRVSNGTGYVKDYTLEELKKLNFNKSHPEYGFIEIPTLEEVYNIIKPSNLSVNVEIKSGIYFYEELEERVLKLTYDLGMQDRVMYSSFNHYSMMKIKTMAPDAQVGILYEDGFMDVPHYAKKYGIDALHPSLNNLKYPDVIKDSKELGLKLHVWIVNEEKDMKKLCEYGIDAIITNYPDRARKIVDL